MKKLKKAKITPPSEFNRDQQDKVRLMQTTPTIAATTSLQKTPPSLRSSLCDSTTQTTNIQNAAT